MARRPCAVVTGASRGIGKAIAISLARRGYDVGITARTIREGDGRNPSDGSPLVGSLETTASEIEAHQGSAVPVTVDLLDLDGLEPAWQRLVDGLGGRVDLLVNNAIYAGPGNDTRLVGVDPADIIRRVTANVTAQILLSRLAVAHMLSNSADEHGWRGTLLNITSAAGQNTPRRAAGEGGWPLTYAATKAGFHRIADMLALEYGDQGIRAININPGFVATERVLASEELAFVAKRGVPTGPIGDAVVTILDDASIANGGYVHAQDYLAES